jgi:peptide deformylase
MKIVSIDEIPKSTDNTPCDNLVEVYSTGQKMEKICKENNGVGLAAAQVGIPWKFFVYEDQSSNKFKYMIDCEYFPINEEKYLSIEGCLSIKTNDNKMRHFKVMRFKEIKVVGKILEDGDKLEIKNFEKIYKNNLECTIIQHEIDHQDDILISDIGEEISIQEKIEK